MAAKPNFQALWVRLAHIAEEVGDSRLRAVLKNHEDRREYICRKLGVVTEADVQRIRSQREARKAR